MFKVTGIRNHLNSVCIVLIIVLLLSVCNEGPDDILPKLNIFAEIQIRKEN